MSVPDNESLTEVLQPVLVKAEQKLERRASELAEAKLAFARQKTETTRIARFIEDMKGNSKTRVTKETLRPAVMQMLNSSAGGLSKDDAKKAVMSLLKRKGINATGVQSVIDSLHAELADANGVWQAPSN